MFMVVKFGKFNGDIRQITKLMTDVVEVTGTLRDKCDVLTPELLVKTDVREFNYVYIDEFTPFLKDGETGELVDTEVIRIKRPSFLRKYNKRNG